MSWARQVGRVPLARDWRGRWARRHHAGSRICNSDGRDDHWARGWRVCFLACDLKSKFGVDDSLDVWGVHGVGGTLGAILTGVFAQLL